MDGVQTYRNPGLVNILNKLHYIENFGTGISRIIEAYANSNKKPVFDPSDNFFILTLLNLNYIDQINDQVNDVVKVNFILLLLLSWKYIIYLAKGSDERWKKVL